MSRHPRLRALSPVVAGGVAERFKAHAWKACWGLRPSGVRIPVPPPDLLIFKSLIVISNGYLFLTKWDFSGIKMMKWLFPSSPIYTFV